MRDERTARRRRRVAGLVRWHRRVGLAAAIFFVFLAVTGTLLGHADRLGLTGARAEWEFVLALYGRAAPGEPLAFAVDGSWVAWLDGALFVDDTVATRDTGKPLGAAAAGPGIAVATSQAVFLLRPDGALIERLDRPALPGAPEALGRTPEGRLALRTPRGIYLADAALLGWEEVPTGTDVQWSAPSALPPQRTEALLAAWRGPAPTWDRVLADVHSGRILGRWGPWLVDILSLALVVLVATGVIQWARRR